MNEKHRRFCEEYMIDHNATQAAIRAGYSEKTAKQIGSRLLTYVDVQEEIGRLATQIKKESIATAREVLEHFTAVMRGEILDQVVRPDEDGNMQRVEVAAKLSDRNKAAEALAKHYALLVEKVELTKPKAEIADEIEAMIGGN